MAQFLVYKTNNAEPVYLDLDPEKICLSAPVKRYGGSQCCEISYEHEGQHIPLKLQFPPMHAPFAFRRSAWQGVSRNYFEFSTSFYGEEARPELQDLRTLLESIQLQLISILHENYEEWFSGDPRVGPKSQESMNEMTIPLIKSGWSPKQNKMFEDTINFKCPIRQGVVQTLFFTNDDTPPRYITTLKDVDMCKKEVMVLAELGEMWINNHYSSKFQVSQVLILQPRQEAECTLMAQ